MVIDEIKTKRALAHKKLDKLDNCLSHEEMVLVWEKAYKLIECALDGSIDIIEKYHDNFGEI